jgi:UDP-N-acetylmuramoyl-L-alanyl-D-glutamate--2,6-diaminopimelate ligase
MKKITVGTVSNVLAGFPQKSALSESVLKQEVTGITADSRQVKAGFVFVAVRGATQDGHQFISEVARRKPSLMIVESLPDHSTLSIPHIQVSSSRQALAKAAANFYGDPSHGMKVIGVTGTSGKTTMTYLLESILRAQGEEVGVIGTINFRYKDRVLAATHTTPGAVEIQALLAEMKASGCTAAVLEVSSHALKQNRAAFIAYDAMVFTNLSPEHQDFHPDMEDYFQSKAILFRGSVIYSVNSGKTPVLAINVDDAYGDRLAKELQKRTDSRIRLLPFGVGEGDVTTDLQGIRGEINGVKVDSRLRGKFNVYNLFAAIAVAQGMGLDRAKTAAGIAALKKIPGRLEPVENSRGITILVDYAHKSDALEKVLSTLREIRGRNRLITVMGCGGDRDRKKRPVMGKIAAELSDHVFVTSDNPRSENPIAIIEEILTGMQGSNHKTVEPDRRKAIFAAIASARKGDIVLIAGKGHEDYQILGTEKVHFDDREVAAEAVAALP